MSNELKDPGDVVVIGRVQGAFGVQGWIRLVSYTDPVSNLLEYTPWLLQEGDSWRELKVYAVRAQRNGFVAQVADVDDRDVAASLRGRLIGVAQDVLPRAGNDEFYWRDLVGLAVKNTRGEHLGRVVEVMATGANDVLVVDLDSATNEDRPDEVSQELIPFHRQFVAEVDLSGGTLTVDWTVGESI
jgi:16S rRNA processing protein RimM